MSAAARPLARRLRSTRPFVAIRENTSVDLTPQHQRIFQKSAEANLDGPDRHTSVSVSDWEERGGAAVHVYIQHEHFDVGAEFSAPMMVEHLNELIDMLVAVRDAARREGILR